MKRYLLAVVIALSLNIVKANYLQIGVPTVSVPGSSISFTIQWDNSWYIASGPTNWDGVWVFVKR